MLVPVVARGAGGGSGAAFLAFFSGLPAEASASALRGGIPAPERGGRQPTRPTPPPKKRAAKGCSSTQRAPCINDVSQGRKMVMVGIRPHELWEERRV